jgi:hypothetical protein
VAENWLVRVSHVPANAGAQGRLSLAPPRCVPEIPRSRNDAQTLSKKIERVNRPHRHSLCSRGDEVTGCCWLPKKASPALDTAQKPYYCVSKYPHVGAVLLATALLGHAPARSTRASAANRRDNISAYWRDDSVIATGNVTSKRRFMSARSIPAPCGGPCEEQKSTRKQGAPSALS